MTTHNIIFKFAIMTLTIVSLSYNSALANSSANIANNSINKEKFSKESNVITPSYLVIFEIKPEWNQLHGKTIFSLAMQKPEYSSIFKQHFSYMKTLSAKGIIHLGGPMLNSLSVDSPLLDGAMFIYNAENQIEAEQYIKNDPLIIGNIMQIKSIKPFIRGI